MEDQYGLYINLYDKIYLIGTGSSMAAVVNMR